MGDKYTYDGWGSTWFSTSEGAQAYCAEPAKSTPDSGTYTKESVEFTTVDGSTHTLQQLGNVLWSGYGGPAFNPDNWISTWYDGTAWTNARYAAITHIMVADLVNFNGWYAMYGCSDDFQEWVYHNFIGWCPSYEDHKDQITGATFLRTAPSEFLDSIYQLSTGSNTQTMVSYTPGGWIDLTKVSNEASLGLPMLKQYKWRQ